MPHLTLVLDNREVRKFALNRGITTIGRAQDNDIVINNLALSRRHAQVELRSGRFEVSDLGSQNGVFVNQERLRGPRALLDGDQITLGTYHFVFADEGEVEGEPRRDRAPRREPTEPEPAAEPPPVRPKPVPLLVLKYNDVELQRLELRGESYLIGRAKECDLQVAERRLSRKHCEIQLDPAGRWLVSDLGSQNGTYVNRRRIKGPQPLQSGDVLNFAEYSVLFLGEGSAYVGPDAEPRSGRPPLEAAVEKADTVFPPAFRDTGRGRGAEGEPIRPTALDEESAEAARPAVHERPRWSGEDGEPDPLIQSPGEARARRKGHVPPGRRSEPPDERPGRRPEPEPVEERPARARDRVVPPREIREERAGKEVRTPREERAPREERPVRDDRPARSLPTPVRDERVAREEKPVREERAAREERVVRDEKPVRDDRGVREERVGRDDKLPREERPRDAKAKATQPPERAREVADERVVRDDRARPARAVDAPSRPAEPAQRPSPSRGLEPADDRRPAGERRAEGRGRGDAVEVRGVVEARAYDDGRAARSAPRRAPDPDEYPDVPDEPESPRESDLDEWYSSRVERSDAFEGPSRDPLGDEEVLPDDDEPSGLVPRSPSSVSHVLNQMMVGKRELERNLQQARAPDRKFSVEVRHGDEVIFTGPLPGPVTVLGTEADADIRLRGRYVAKRHSLLVRVRESLLLVRLGSSSAARVNGLPKLQAFLRHGDLIQIDETSLRIFEE